MNESTDSRLAHLNYWEFEIEVGQCRHCDQREIRVLSSRFDRPREKYEPRLDPEELNSELEELDDLMLQNGAEAIDRRKRLAQKIGQDLYEALLPRDIHHSFDKSLAAVRTAEEHNLGLRIHLGFGEVTDYHSEVVGLPWELICFPKTGEFPVSASETPLVRSLDLDRPVESVEIEPPIRVLAVLASPHDAGLSQIDLAKHRRPLEKVCNDNSQLDLVFLEPPSLGSLREKLEIQRRKGRPIHVLHFLGHGGFTADGEGFLCFEDKRGGRQDVPGRALSQALGGYRELRLAVLSTCIGARMMRREGQHPFTGSASALVAGGLPAVVGMQFPFSEDAATYFTDAFYSHVSRGKPLEEAVTEGRLKILGEEPESLEWASPVLFLRARSGKVFELVANGKPTDDKSQPNEAIPSQINRNEYTGRDRIKANGDVTIDNSQRS